MKKIFFIFFALFLFNSIIIAENLEDKVTKKIEEEAKKLELESIVKNKLEEELKKTISEQEDSKFYYNDLESATKKAISESRLLIIWVGFKNTEKSKDILPNMVHYYKDKNFTLPKTNITYEKCIIICRITERRECVISKILYENELSFDNVVNHIKYLISIYGAQDSNNQNKTQQNKLNYPQYNYVQPNYVQPNYVQPINNYSQPSYSG